MLKETIGYGSTVEEATEDAKLKLGVKEDEDFQIDVVSMPKKKIMGIFGGSQAEVRITVERPDEKPAKKEKAARPQKKSEQSKENQNVKKVQKEKTVKQKKAPVEAKVPENLVDSEELNKEGRAYKAVSYLKTVLEKMNCENITVKVAEREGGALMLLEGDGLNAIIGRHGETLDALQHLVSLSARDNNGYYKVTLNIGNFRERREDTLSKLAARVAETVKKTGKGKALEPMNPYERRIIHTVIQDIEGVTSASVGEGASRRVVIVLEGGNVNDVRFERQRKGKGHSRNGFSKNYASKPSAPAREPRNDNVAYPLYGKIEPKNTNN